MKTCWISREEKIFLDRKRVGFVAFLLLLGTLSVGRASAQEPAPAPPPATAPPLNTPEPASPPDPAAQPAAAPAETPVATPPPSDSTKPAEQEPAASPATNQVVQVAKPAEKAAAHPKKGAKVPYTGPTNVVELPPTPMLDSEGKQRLDPDGKPMFNPPVKQQRDKFGHPLFTPDGKPVFQTATDLGYDERGKKIAVKKVKPPKTTSVSISRGTLTVDGLIGKAALNYDIADLHYIYLYAPWIGTVVVSNQMFPGATVQQNAWNGNTLKVTVEDHTFEVYSDKLLLGKKPEPGYVLVDRDFKLPTNSPVMGYGPTAKAPYVWPGAKDNPDSKAFVKAPPVPDSLRPMKKLPPCPPGQMRDMVILPGDTKDTAPCVAITAAKPTPAPAPARAPSSTPPPADLAPTPAPPPAPPPPTDGGAGE
jgi:hypothetical protein